MAGQPGPVWCSEALPQECRYACVLPQWEEPHYTRPTMQLGEDAMMTALRVLSAIVNERDPDPDDVEELRRIPPSRAAVPLDELACNVVQQARMDLGWMGTSAYRLDLDVLHIGAHRAERNVDASGITQGS
jgi:hypothetical protein